MYVSLDKFGKSPTRSKVKLFRDSYTILWVTSRREVPFYSSRCIEGQSLLWRSFLPSRHGNQHDWACGYYGIKRPPIVEPFWKPSVTPYVVSFWVRQSLPVGKYNPTTRAILGSFLWFRQSSPHHVPRVTSTGHGSWMLLMPYLRRSQRVTFLEISLDLGWTSTEKLDKVGWTWLK